MEIENLIDTGLLQTLQNQFCKGCGIYMFCVDSDYERLTQFSGGEQERGWLEAHIPMERYRSLVEKSRGNNVEPIVEEPLEEPYVRLCAVAINISGKDQITWMAAAILQEKAQPGQVPEYLASTDAEHLYRSLEFLVQISRLLFAAKLEEMIAQEAMEESVAAKNSLASSYEALEAILENAGCGIFVVDPENGKLLFMNEKIKEIFPRTAEEARLEELFAGQRDVRNSYEEVYIPDEDRWVDLNRTRIKWVDGREVSLCTVYDVTDKKNNQKKIEHQANNDFLTGLFNRMRCEQDLETYIQETVRNGGRGALLYLDLDDFKNINDALGHEYGDILLKEISDSIRRIEGVGDNCYRMGGDEFIVIVTDRHFRCLPQIVRDVQNMFASPWFLKGSDYFCTMCMGIAYFPTDADSVGDVIRKADLALNAAKRKGKNKVEFYNDADEGSPCRRLDLENNIRRAAMNSISEFEVYYQPITDITGAEDVCCGAEALARWNSSELGFISPGDFIPIAEYLGLINPIGEHILKRAARTCKHWNDSGHPDYHVNVNLSVVQLLQKDIVQRIRDVLEETQVVPANLRLEVTESLAINDMTRMVQILTEIKALGVGVALDDFGTGYSSLNHIRALPIDVIKIDRCFIEHIAEDDFSAAFVNMVVQLADAIDVQVCVEGVELISQYDKVKAANVDMIQGYFFGKPMRLEEFEERYL